MVQKYINTRTGLSSLCVIIGSILLIVSSIGCSKSGESNSGTFHKAPASVARDHANDVMGIAVGDTRVVHNNYSGFRSDGPYETVEVYGFFQNSTRRATILIELERQNSGEYKVTRTKNIQ